MLCFLFLSSGFALFFLLRTLRPRGKILYSFRTKSKSQSLKAAEEPELFCLYCMLRQEKKK